MNSLSLSDFLAIGWKMVYADDAIQHAFEWQASVILISYSGRILKADRDHHGEIEVKLVGQL